MGRSRLANHANKESRTRASNTDREGIGELITRGLA